MPRVATADYAKVLAAVGEPPARPALRPEVIVIRSPSLHSRGTGLPTADRSPDESTQGEILLAGMADPARLRGDRTVAALDVLLPLLDGSRDEALLVADSGLPAATVRQLLGVLTMRSVLQNGPVAVSPEPTGVFVSRAVARTGWHDRADESLAELAAATVAVPGTSQLASAVRTELLAAGVLGAVLGQVTPTTSLVVSCSGSVRYDVPAMSVRLDGAALTCGPYLEAGAAPSAVDAAGDGADVGLAAALVAGEVLNLLGGLGRSVTETGLVRHDLATGTTSYFDLFAAGESPTLDLIRQFEAAVSLPDRRWLPPALHREHYRPGHLAAQLGFNRAGGTVAEVPGPIRELLRRSVGLRVPVAPGASPDRYAPSAGNLGAVVGYCTVPDEAGNLQAYQYDPLRDELINLGIDVAPGRATMVVLTADLTKLLAKYGLKSYRLAYLEAGAALAQLAIAAADQGIGVQALPLDDSAWSGLLGTDGRGELLCAAVRFGGGSSEPVPANPESRQIAGPIPRHELGARLAMAMRSAPKPGHRAGKPTVGEVSLGTLDRRRSIRTFGPAAVDGTALSGAIEIALSADRSLWPDAVPELAPVILVHRVEAVPVGVVRSGQTGLTHIGPLPAPWHQLLLQPELTDAAAIVVWTAPLGPAVDRLGAPGYRELLVRAGAAANTCVLAPAGLGGCVFDGLLPAARAIVEPDTALIAVALGVPEAHDDGGAR